MLVQDKKMKAIIFVLLGILVATQALPRKPKNPNKPLVVGGKPALKNSLPYQVSLRYYDEHTCGGTIITKDYIVTAGHCVEYVFPSEPFTVVAGDHNLFHDDGTEQVRNVSRIITHEDYGHSFGHSVNDIALLKLEKPLTLNGAVKTLPLAPEGHGAIGDLIVSGWGNLASGGEGPGVLHQVIVPIVSDEKCRESYGESEIWDNVICAGSPDGGVGSCQGDSGGPCVSNDLGYSYLAGVVSWGKGCGLAGYPGVYTEVSYFEDWIAKNIID